VARALAATRASKRIAFERDFVPAAPAAWCQFVKDIAALANSDGGAIVVGVDRRGVPTGWNPDALLDIGRGQVVEKLAQYLGERFDDIALELARKSDRRVAVVSVGPRRGSPLVFETQGTYVDLSGVEHTAFHPGQVYFRHGGSSRPATARDMTQFARREDRALRRDLVKHLRRLSQAPVGSDIIVVPPESAAAGNVERFRVVDDPQAAVLARTDFDVTHPYRQKELIEAFNRRVGRPVVTGYDILCVRKVLHTDERPEFFHRPKFGSPQYSDAFLTWLLDEYTADPRFFDDVKAKYRR
jgi:hypothetical protein